MNDPVLTLALLIVAEHQQRKLPFYPDDSPFETDIATVIGALFRDWPDEWKADLYAQLAEKLTPGMFISQMQTHITRALQRTRLHFHVH
jgi:hypothetical protein